MNSECHILFFGGGEQGEWEVQFEEIKFGRFLSKQGEVRSKSRGV